MKDILKTIPLFRELTDSELGEVADVAVPRSESAGSKLFDTGDPSDCFYLITSGRVKIRIPPKPGHDERILYLGPGKFFGEMGVIRNTPRTADAIVQDDAELVVIQQEDFDYVMSMNDVLSMKVTAAFQGRLHELQEKLGGGSVDRPSCIVFFSTGAGSGASFLCANLAAKIHHLTQKTTLVLDMDLDGPIQHLYGGDGAEVGGLPELFQAPQITPEVVQDVAHTLASGVELISGPGLPPEGTVTPEIMPEVLRNALKACYYVLVDTDSSMNTINEALIGAADAVFLVVGPDAISLSRAEILLEKLEALEMGRKVRLVLNRFGRGITQAALEERLGKQVLGQVQQDDASALAALNAGQPVVDHNNRSRISADLTRLARQALALPAEEEGGFSIWNLFG